MIFLRPSGIVCYTTARPWNPLTQDFDCDTERRRPTHYTGGQAVVFSLNITSEPIHCH